MTIYEDLFSVAGKTAVVTGGAKGIGAMISRALVEAGANVIIVSRDTEANRRFVEDLARTGNCRLVAHDLSTASGVADAAGAISDSIEAVHVLVNNAGTFTGAPIGELTTEAWDREVAINLRAPFQLVQALLPKLRAGASAESPSRVINIGSIAALWAKSSQAYAYGASKAGLHQLTRMLASDLTKDNITVNAIAPGFFPSDMTDGFFEAVPGLKEQMIASIPAQRLGTREDVGGAVLFLASRAGSYLSGAILPLEGALWSA
jgi:NAD(P)-dependent dehydrogenase (short-subunit alcohol dehydrogenase family)